MLAFMLAAILAIGDDRPPALSPSESLSTIRVPPGLKVELVASEPLIVDPVAIDWGLDGTLWVCEMHDYPMGLDGKFQPGGRIKALKDDDDDGVYDRATTFLDGLPFPTGVMAWRKGVLICAAPDIIYAEDTDGDGKADVRKVLFRGFATENYQARVNGLSYGLDNWVYGANGLIGGRIQGEASGKLVNIGGRDFRIRFDTGVIEPESGLSQQGRIHDDFNNQFGNSNSVWLQHFPIADHYARRNPHVAATETAVYVPRDPDSARLYPASTTLTRFNEPQSANRVTSACGPCIYRDDYLGDPFRGNAFICEPVHNLIHRQVIVREGATFAGHRAKGEERSEFLASTDNWFRPVQVRTGPDGALYVVDMYRFVIEHPRWIAPELLKTLDVRAGSDKGRIYRVVREAQPPRTIAGSEHDISAAKLAESLDTPSGTLRDSIQSRLVERGDPAAAPALVRLAKMAKRPEVRAQAIGTLDGLRALTNDLLRSAIDDASPDVRIVAIRFAETRFGGDSSLGPAVAAKADDPVAAVRYQAALSLGEWNHPGAGTALGKIAVRDASDRRIVAAVHSSAARHPGAILAEVFKAEIAEAFAPSVVGPLVITAARIHDPAAMLEAIKAVRSDGPSWRLGALADLLDAAPKILESDRSTLDLAIGFARKLAIDADALPTDRTNAVRLLGRERIHTREDASLASDLLSVKSPLDLQRGAVAALTRMGRDDRLVEALPRLGPELRLRILDSLLARASGTASLLSAVKSGRIPADGVSAAHRDRLLNHATPEIRRTARELWPERPLPDSLRLYAEAAANGGDADRGSTVFARVCSACHKLDGKGHEVGPDLAALTDRSPAALLPFIFDPNREVDARYVGYVAAMKDGRVLSGMLASETGNAIVLKGQGGELFTVLRSDLDEFKSTGKSLMPEGLNRDVTPDECADLLAFLARHGPRPKQFAGNTPKQVEPRRDGTIRLDASTAEMFGATIGYESEFSNLGYWQSLDDRAAWSFRVEHPGDYDVIVRLACADGSAGNLYVVRSGRHSITAKVAGTGPDWSMYREFNIGQVPLPKGVQRIEVCPDGALNGSLMDLRSVELRRR